MAESGESEELDGPAATGDSSRVFISYATHDAPVAKSVCSALEAAGFSCWIAPRDVVPGTIYADGIIRAINDSKILVLILSESAVASAHVGKELERASSKRHPIIALRLDVTPLTPAFEYFLSESQWIEMGAGSTDTAIAQLVGAVRRHLSPGVASPSTHSPQLQTVRGTVASPRRSWVAAALIAPILVAVYLLADKLWLHRHGASADRLGGAASAIVGDKSIAVLPFTDMSEKMDQGYFADGITEELLDRLAKIPGLRVVGRASSFQFRGKAIEIASVGAALGVAYLVEGSVRRDAQRVRVAAQLVDARTGVQRWSDRFDSEMIDALHVQDTIAAELGRALQIAVEVDTAPRSMVKSQEALDAYLRGRQSLDRSSRESCEAAVANFQKALTLDPSFAPAAIGLAKTYAFMGSEAWLLPRIAYERAREAALLAQRLDPRVRHHIF